MCDVWSHSGTSKSRAWGELALEVTLGNVSPLGSVNTGKKEGRQKDVSEGS